MLNATYIMGLVKIGYSITIMKSSSRTPYEHPLVSAKIVVITKAHLAWD